MTINAALLALHAVGAALWVGGMFFALVVLPPAIAPLDEAAGLAVQERVLRRFFLVVWHVIPVMLITGYAMEYRFYGGFRAAPWPLQAMTALGIAMSAIFIAIAGGPGRSLRRGVAAGDTVRAGDVARRVRTLVAANLVVGLVIIAVAMFEY
jgi:uncharacterized membrane protein